MNLELRFANPGQVPQTIPMVESRLIIGTLLSNQVVLRAPGVDPIHAMIEQNEADGGWVVTDLGSQSGTKVNGKKLEVEAKVKVGDVITIGSVDIKIEEPKLAPVPFNLAKDLPPIPEFARNAPESPDDLPELPDANVAEADLVSNEERTRTDARQTVRREEVDNRRLDQPKIVLFSPRSARPTGDVLEVVAYWGDTVLDVEHFHPNLAGYEKVTIGDPTKAHFIAAGKQNYQKLAIAAVTDSGYKISLDEGMDGRLRKGGKVERVSGKGSFSLGRRDIAHIRYGAVKYFFLFVSPPVLNLPKSGPRDPFFVSLLTIAMLIYALIVPLAIMRIPDEKVDDKDDIWSIVNLPEKPKPPEKVIPPPKPKVEIAEKKVTPPPQKTPPPPKPKPPQAVKPVEVEKPKQPDPVKKPIPEPVPVKRELATLTENKNPQPKTTVAPQEKKPDLSSLSKSAADGMPSTGAKSPNFKLAGPKTSDAKGAAGGARGSGMNQVGGEIKGKQKASVMGVEGPKNNQASGVNLSKLSLGAGKIFTKTADSAVYTNFKNSGGGLGGGSGSGAKTRGLGGVGGGNSLGLAGSGQAINNFGSGSGGMGSGEGGTGGLGGSGMGNAFGGGAGKGRASVSVPAEDPVVSGGLTAQEVQAVIKAHLNEIRHCYEQLLQRSPSSSGKVSVLFVVSTSGRVQAASIQNSSISDPVMQGCVTGRIQRWQFPSPRGGQPVTVTYPFVFNPL